MGCTQAAEEAGTKPLNCRETDNSCTNTQMTGNLFLMDETGLKCTRLMGNAEMEIFFFGPYFCAVYDPPAGIFHGIKDMARKQKDVYTHAHTHTHRQTQFCISQP